MAITVAHVFSRGIVSPDAAGRLFRVAIDLDAFYRQIESDDLFYRPVVTSETSATIPRADANGAFLCAERVTIPAGTPMSAPLSAFGSWVEVRLPDVFWTWASSARCEALRRSPMWIEASHIAPRP